MKTASHDIRRGGGRVAGLHHLMIAVLAIGAFALVVGAGPAFADHHVGDITLHTADTLADTSATLFGLLDTLDTVKIGDKYYIMTAGRGNSDRGFQVIEITDPTNIHAEGKVAAFQNILDVNFHQIGTNIYALTASQHSSGGIQIINITVPSSPTVVATVRDNSNNFTKLAEVSNVAAIQIGDRHYAMATSFRENGFEWMDITNVTGPTHVFTGSDVSLVPAHFANGQFTDLEDAGSFFFRQLGSQYYAYIAGSGGVQIVNLTDPASPTAAGRELSFANEPHLLMHYQAGSKEYMIASVASEDDPDLWIREITGAPVYPLASRVAEGGATVIATEDRQRLRMVVTADGTNLQDFDIFEMEGRTYLALVSRNDLKAVTFVDITDPHRASITAQIRESAHGFSTLTGLRGVSAIDIDGLQYVAVGGTEGITLIHVRPYGMPVLEVETTSNVVSDGNGYAATLASDDTHLILNVRSTVQPPSGTSIRFDVQTAVYQDESRVPSYVSPRHGESGALSLSITPGNWNRYQALNITGLDRNWDQEYATIMIYTSSSNYLFAGRPVTSIYVTGSSQSSPSTQEGGELYLPTTLSLSLGQASVGEDVGTVDITATLDAPAPPEGVSVSLYSSGGTATEGTDYTMPTSIYIAAGERSGSASITIADDTVAESDESVSISSYVDIFGQEMTDSITLTITDNDGTTVVVDQDNQPPTISSAISDVIIVRETGTRTISLSGVFSDADNDSLNVTATSSDATKAAVSVSSDYTSLTLTAQARGTATVTVTADDGNGGTISDVFTVQIKAAPTVSSAISDISGMSIGDSRDISLAGVFGDADSDPLNVTASTSDYNIAEAIIFQDTLTIIAVSNGSATITVTAQDTDGNRATDTFEVTVAAAQQQNRAPTISSAISDVTIPHETGTRTISLSGVFSDADNDSLNVTATSSDATKAAVSVSSDYTSLTLTAQARGTATVTVTADDGNGGTISDVFTVQIKAAPTVSSAISDVSGLDVGDSRDISLDGVFDDADGDSLVITVESSNGSVATVEAASDGSALTITAQAPGTATIRVTAQDADGNQVTDTFEVTVAAAQQTANTSELEPIVAQYDTDGSGAIEQDEWEVAVQDHADGKLTNEEIFAISEARTYN